MLNHKITLYVPGTVQGNVPSPHMQAIWTDKVLRGFAEVFGGATLTHATGAWVSPTLGLVKEPVNLVSSFTDLDGVRAHIGDVKRWAAAIAEEMGQEAVALEVSGEMEFVSAAVVKNGIKFQTAA
jgi:hypothetical protein